MGDTDVFNRKPYRSGGSQVITVSGIPGISEDKELNLKRVKIGDVEATIMVSYDELSKHELEELSDTLMPADD